jgi:hypothetical protein
MQKWDSIPLTDVKKNALTIAAVKLRSMYIIHRINPEILGVDVLGLQSWTVLP